MSKFEELLFCNDEFGFKFEGKEYQIIFEFDENISEFVRSLYEYDGGSGIFIESFKDNEEFWDKAAINQKHLKDNIYKIKV